MNDIWVLLLASPFAAWLLEALGARIRADRKAARA